MNSEENEIKNFTDHEGNEFCTQKEMCEYWHIKTRTYTKRIANGWTIERALTTPTEGNICFDHTGRKFQTQKEMCEYWDVCPSTFLRRIADGWSTEAALTTKTGRQKKKDKEKIQQTPMPYGKSSDKYTDQTMCSRSKIKSVPYYLL